MTLKVATPHRLPWPCLHAVSFSRAVEVGLNEARTFVFRERALRAHKKAMRAGIPEEIRRAWLIVERDWARMAEREELNDAMSWLDGAARNPMRNGK